MHECDDDSTRRSSTGSNSSGSGSADGLPYSSTDRIEVPEFARLELESAARAPIVLDFDAFHASPAYQ
eukprot:7385367-Prymnesium_polylepis.1